MIHEPKTLRPTATVGDVRRLFEDDHVHLALLVDGGFLCATVTRVDVGGSEADEISALALPRLDDLAIARDTSAQVAFHRMVERRQRRLAVVADDGRVQGLLCLKRRLNGFCSDASVGERAHAAT